MKKPFTYLLLASMLLVLAMGSQAALAATTSDTPPGGAGNTTSDTPPGGPGNTTSDTPPGGSTQFMLSNPLKFDTVGGIISGALDIFTYLVVIFAVLMIIYVGLRFVMAQGNMEELKTRKDQLLYLMVGVALVIGARLIVSIILNTLDATGVVQPGVINSARDGLK